MKKKFKWLLILAVAVLSCAAYGTVLLKPISAEAEKVVRGDLSNSFTVQGEVVPEKSLVLNSLTSGQVVSLPFQAGNQVKAGEVLMETGGASQTDLDIQREQYRQQLASARQQYDRLFGEGGSAAASLISAKSEYDLAEQNYKNAQTLFDDGGYISQTELDNAKTERDLAFQKYEQAGEDNSDATREYYQGLIASAEKQLNMLEDTVKPGAVKMPWDGVVWEVYTDVGTYLSQNQPVVKVYEPGDMKITASLLSEDAVLIKPDQTAKVKYADGTEEELKVTFVSPVAGKEISSIGMEENRCTVELRPEKLPGQAGAGQEADVTFTAVSAERVITVPSLAVVPDGRESFVYTVEGSKAVLKQVETGRKSGGRVEILSGLSEGEAVLTDPYDAKVKKGSRVDAVFSEKTMD